MYPVSEAYKNAISQNERNVRIAGTITLKDNSVIQIDDKDILQGSLYFTEQCVSGEDIEIGNVYASEMGLTLTSPPENPYSLDGARIILNFGIETSEGVWEYVPLGYFYVTEIERKATVVNLKALDGMILFDVPMDGVLTAGTPYALIDSCCTKAGVTLATSMEEFQGFANGLTAFTIPSDTSDSKIETCRDLLMWVCQLTGTFARMNRLGQLEIIPITGRAPVKTISKDERFVSDVSDFNVKISKVSMKVGETEYSQGTDGMTMVLEENPLLAEKTDAEINAILSNILNQVATAEYVPYNVNFAGDPALQAGDFVTLTGIKVFDKVSGIFTRSSVAYLSDGTQVDANMPRFEQGKFGKAVLVEEGTTNYFTANGGVNLTSISAYSATVAPTYSHLSGEKWYGTTPLRVNMGEGGVRCFSQGGMPTDRTNGTTYTFSIYVRSQVTRTLRLYTDEGSGPRIECKSGVWTRLTLTFTTTATYRWLNVEGWQPYDVIDFAAPLLEAKPYPTSFIDGTRAAESLTIPTDGVLNAEEGTLQFWVKDIANIPNTNMLFIARMAETYGNSTAGVCVYIYNNHLTIRINGQLLSAKNKTAYGNDWKNIACRWSSSRISLFVDGVEEAFSDTPNPPQVLTSWAYVGLNSNGDRQCNTLIDDLRISNRALTDEEIAAAYASGQPLPVDEYTTLKMNFDGSLTTITTVGDSIVTHSNWRYRGPHNIKAVGKSSLIRGVQAQQGKSVSAIQAIAKAAQEIAKTANQSTQLINDAITGYVLIRKNETTGSNEILIMDNPDPAQARKIWRWNMGGLGYSDNVVGVDNPDRVYTVAMTMDGAINANFIKTGKLDSSVVRIGPETVYELEEKYTWDRYAGMTWQEVIDSLGG